MKKSKTYSQYDAGIIGMGSHLPPNVVTNKDMEKMMDTSDEWITTKLGIKSRRFARDDQNLSDLCVPAARKAIKDAGLKPADIDLVLVGSMSHDYCGGILTSNIIKEKIKADNAFGMDMTIICPGSIYCAETAANFIRSGRYKHVLVVNGEVFSRFNHTRVTRVIFGDGAGAFVMGRVKKGYGLLESYIKSTVKDADKLAMLGGGSKHPFNQKNLDAGLFQIQMDGRVIYDFAVNAFPDAVAGVLKKAKMRKEDIKLVISHQANINIIKKGMDDSGIPFSKTYNNIHKYGNIGGGSVNVALDEAIMKGLLKKGDLVLCVAFGAGLAYGANIMRWAY